MAHLIAGHVRQGHLEDDRRRLRRACDVQRTVAGVALDNPISRAAQQARKARPRHLVGVGDENRPPDIHASPSSSRSNIELPPEERGCAKADLTQGAGYWIWPRSYPKKSRQSPNFAETH